MLFQHLIKFRNKVYINIKSRNNYVLIHFKVNKKFIKNPFKSYKLLFFIKKYLF